MSEIKYSVTIKDQTAQGNDTVATQATAITTKPAGTPLTERDAVANNSASGLQTALVAVKTLEPYVNAAINYGISQIQFATGSVELQQRAQVFSGLATSAISVGMAAAIGGPAGAAAMVGLKAVQIAMTATQNYTNIQNARALEKETISNIRSRLGIITRRSREA